MGRARRILPEGQRPTMIWCHHCCQAGRVDCDIQRNTPCSLCDYYTHNTAAGADRPPCMRARPGDWPTSHMRGIADEKIIQRADASDGRIRGNADGYWLKADAAAYVPQQKMEQRPPRSQQFQRAPQLTDTDTRFQSVPRLAQRQQQQAPRSLPSAPQHPPPQPFQQPYPELQRSGIGSFDGTPVYGPPGFSPPSYDMPGYGTPGYDVPVYGLPGYGVPGYGVPSYGLPGYGLPGYVAPGFSMPDFGPGSFGGMPVYGMPGYGMSGYGVPGLGMGNFTTQGVNPQSQSEHAYPPQAPAFPANGSPDVSALQSNASELLKAATNTEPPKFDATELRRRTPRRSVEGPDASRTRDNKRRRDSESDATPRQHFDARGRHDSAPRGQEAAPSAKTLTRLPPKTLGDNAAKRAKRAKTDGSTSSIGSADLKPSPAAEASRGSEQYRASFTAAIRSWLIFQYGEESERQAEDFFEWKMSLGEHEA